MGPLGEPVGQTGETLTEPLPLLSCAGMRKRTTSGQPR